MEKANKYLEMLIYITVVDEGNFISAANKLNLSKQAVSRYISSLEQRLQVRLLQRTTRTMALTYEGQNFYLYAKNIINSIDEAESAIHSDQVDPTGLIRINVPVSFGILKLAPLWQPFLDKYPNINLDITLSDRFVNLLDEGYDLVVRIGKLDDSSLVGRKLTSTKMIAVASPQYLEKYGHPIYPDDIKTHKIIMYSHWIRKDQWVFWQGNKAYPVQIKSHLYCNNGDTCRMMMLQHGGISLQPDFIIENDIKKGDLVPILPDYKIEDLAVSLIYPTRKLLPLRTRCLINFLVEHFENINGES